MKKMMLLAAALILVLALAACGGEPETIATTVETETVSDAETLSTFVGILEDKKDFMITVVSEEDGKAYVFNLDGVACPAEESQRVQVTYTGDIRDFDAQLVAVKVEKV